MAPGIVSNLDMTDAFEVGPQDAGELAFHPLRVIDVVLQIDVGVPDLIQYRENLGRRIQREPRDVAGIQMLDQEADIRLLESFRGKPEIVHQRPALLGHGHVRKRFPDQAIDLRYAESPGVFDCLCHALPVFALPRRIYGDSAIARGEISRRQVDQYQLQPI